MSRAGSRRRVLPKELRAFPRRRLGFLSWILEGLGLAELLMPDNDHHRADEPCLAVRVPADGSPLHTISLQVMEGPRNKTQLVRWPHLDPPLKGVTPEQLDYHVFAAEWEYYESLRGTYFLIYNKNRRSDWP